MSCESPDLLLCPCCLIWIFVVCLYIQQHRIIMGVASIHVIPELMFILCRLIWGLTSLIYIKNIFLDISSWKISVFQLFFDKNICYGYSLEVPNTWKTNQKKSLIWSYGVGILISFCSVPQIVSLDEKKPRGIEFNYYILETRSCTGEGSEIDGPDEISIKSFLKAGRLIELDTFSFTNGPYTVIYSKLFFSKYDCDSLKRGILFKEGKWSTNTFF